MEAGSCSDARRTAVAYTVVGFAAGVLVWAILDLFDSASALVLGVAVVCSVAAAVRYRRRLPRAVAVARAVLVAGSNRCRPVDGWGTLRPSRRTWLRAGVVAVCVGFVVASSSRERMETPYEAAERRRLAHAVARIPVRGAHRIRTAHDIVYPPTEPVTPEPTPVPPPTPVPVEMYNFANLGKQGRRISTGRSVRGGADLHRKAHKRLAVEALSQEIRVGDQRVKRLRCLARWAEPGRLSGLHAVERSPHSAPCEVPEWHRLPAGRRAEFAPAHVAVEEAAAACEAPAEAVPLTRREAAAALEVAAAAAGAEGVATFPEHWGRGNGGVASPMQAAFGAALGIASEAVIGAGPAILVAPERDGMDTAAAFCDVMAAQRKAGCSMATFSARARWPRRAVTIKHGIAWLVSDPVPPASVVAVSWGVSALGLGGAGEPLWGRADAAALAAARCAVLPGGVFVAALRIGADTILWNSHRVYAREFWRLPVLAPPAALEAIVIADRSHWQLRRVIRPGLEDGPVNGTSVVNAAMTECAESAMQHCDAVFVVRLPHGGAAPAVEEP
eukprot:TRINITY_DN18973_c0_g1_i1.p3 TRINITY_DN18973_c0_g1~~TRINITY_DN18973_c0_g1_i1.p3  ORF type:complete len:584 (+),score=162.30 TRINITY_DN18973_c0_g1_i1:78-1754(+)